MSAAAAAVGVHTPSCPFRHVPALPSDTQPCSCQQAHKQIITTTSVDDDDDDEEEEDEDEEEDEESASLVGCPIATLSQPLLSLVCRCLDARDLMSMTCTSTQMRDAALQPSTFEHGRWSADPWRSVVVPGPRAVIRTSATLQAALASPLFKCFRRLALHSHDGPSLLHMLSLLASPDAPTLHALQLHDGDQNQSDRAEVSAEDLSQVAGMRDYPSLAHLQTLEMEAHPPLLEHLTRTLPPRLELLQLSLPHFFHDARIQVNPLLSAPHLRAIPTLKYLIIQPASSGSHAHLRDVRMLQAVAHDAPNVQTIEFLLPIDVAAMALDHREALKHNPELQAPLVPRVHRLHIGQGADAKKLPASAPNQLVQTLAMFPDVSALRISSLRVLVDETAEHDLSKHDFPAWSNALTHNLVDLRITTDASVAPQHGHQRALLLLATLAGARLTALQRLTIEKQPGGGVTSHGHADDVLAALLASTPALRHLSVHGLLVSDFTAFKAVPQLQTLRELSWPASVPPPVEEDAATATASVKAIAALFPSLTSLHVSHHDSVRTALPYRTLFHAFPRLRSVQWRRERAMTLAALDEAAARRARAQALQQEKEAAAEQTQRAAYERAVAMRDAGLAPVAPEHDWYRGQSQLNAVAPDMDAAAKRLRREFEQMQASGLRQAAMLAEGSKPGATSEDKQRALQQAQVQMADATKHKHEIDAALAQLEEAHAKALVAKEQAFVLPEFAALALEQPVAANVTDAAPSTPPSAQALFGTNSGGVGGGAKGFKPSVGRAASSGKSRASGGGRLGGAAKLGSGFGGGAADADAAAAAALLTFNDSSSGATGASAAAAPFSNPFSFTAPSAPAASAAAAGDSTAPAANPFATSGAFAFGTSFVPSSTSSTSSSSTFNPFAATNSAAGTTASSTAAAPAADAGQSAK